MRSVAYENGAGRGMHPWMPTVLVVEDDGLVMDVVTEALADDHFRVLTAPDALTARKLLQSDAIDVLFTDIDLGPGPDGLALARLARTLQPGLAVLYASGGLRELRAGQGVFGSAFIPKPYRFGDVCDLLSRLIRAAGKAPM
jgi:DNA-binding response OmpR family regulator